MRDSKSLAEAYAIASKFEQCLDKNKNEENRNSKVNYVKSDKGYYEKIGKFTGSTKARPKIKCFKSLKEGHKANVC